MKDACVMPSPSLQLNDLHSSLLLIGLSHSCASHSPLPSAFWASLHPFANLRWEYEALEDLTVVLHGLSSAKHLFFGEKNELHLVTERIINIITYGR